MPNEDDDSVNNVAKSYEVLSQARARLQRRNKLTANKKTGRDMIGKVPWASHLDHFYLARKDLIDIVVSYFKAGLESNEFCICVTTYPLTAEEVRKAMAESVPDFSKYLGKGQIEMLSYAQWHLHGGCIEILNEALAKGFDSIRATAFIGEQAFIWHMPWLEQGKPQPATPSQ